MVVDQGHEIKVGPESTWETCDVEWRDNMKNLRGKYKKANFQNTSPGTTEPSGAIFIQEEKLDEFKKLGTKDGESLKVKVTESFLYGQKKGGTNRWLVYHDPKRDIFQHRFISSTIMNVQKKAVEVMSQLGYSDIKVVSGILEGTFGDPLRKFT